MVSVRNVGFSVLGLVIMFSSLACGGSSSAPAPAPEKISTLVFEKVVDLPSARVNVVIRHVKLPVGFKTPAHTHKGPGPRYILKGAQEVVEGEVTTTVSAGEVIWESGAVMTAENIADIPTELIAVQLLPVEPEPVATAAKSKISTLLFEKVVDLPSNRVNVVIRHVTLPVGFKTPAHTHKGPGPRYILKGAQEVVEGGVTLTASAGEVFWESGAVMTAESIGDIPMELIAFQLLPVE